MKNAVRYSVSVLVIVLFFCFILPNVALSQSLNIKYGHFPDVENNHWAKQVITKMNLRGVVAGIEEKGLVYFKPDEPVTQLQAVLFALRTMGLEKQVNSGLYLPFTVPDWAREDVITAYEAGLISSNDFEANKEATRAWVAKLLIKMMDKEAELAEVAGEILPFSDSYIIPEAYLNYVKLANKYGLISGYTDNTFKPNQSVTRAQMVAFLSRAEQYLDIKANNLVIGEIEDIKSSNITVFGDDGIRYTFIYNISTNMYGPSGEIGGSSLRVGEKVYLLVDGNIIKYLETNPPEQKTTTFLEGSILQVYPEERTIVLKEDKEGKISTVSLLANTTIVRESDNKSIDLQELNKDVKVRITYDSQGKPVKVTVVHNIINTGTEGIIYDIDTQNKLITLKKTDGLVAYTYDEEVTEVILPNKRFAVIDDLKKGDKISVEATSTGLLQTITLLASEVDLSLTGIVKQINLGDRFITYETEDTRELKAQYVDKNASVDFMGEVGSFSDIMVGDKIQVDVKEGEIKKISVTNRKLQEKLTTTVVAVDDSSRILTIQDANGDLKVYEVSNNADVRINGRKAYLYEIKKDMPIELEIKEDKIIYINAKNTVEGIVSSLNTANKTIELTLSNGSKKTYSLANNAVAYIEGINSYKLDNIDRGDTVEIRLEDNQVKEIKVQRTLIYEVTDVYTNSNRIRVIDKDNDAKYLYFYNDVEIEIPGIANPRVRDFQKGDIIKATYLGFELQKVEISPLIIGTVTSVDSQNGTLTIVAYDGRTYNFEFDAKSRVTKGGRTYYHLGTVNTGDRVVIEENLAGNKFFNIMEKVSGKIGSVYKNKTRLYLQITQTNWKQYDMIPTAYLHAGNIELGPEDFKLNDDVDIYLVDNKVYEVVKK